LVQIDIDRSPANRGYWLRKRSGGKKENAAKDNQDFLHGHIALKLWRLLSYMDSNLTESQVARRIDMS
jgi:hypothetical protein